MNSIDKIHHLYESQGVKPYGEKVTQLQHAIQVAKLAEKNGASDALVAASLLHDIGHLFFIDKINEWQLNDRHEILGASFLNELFGDAVSEPVKLHVMAKRYLCGINQGYMDGLSYASKESLELQGGAVGDSHKRTVFERNPYFNQAIDLRYWDDEGKDEYDFDTDFARYIPLLRALKSAA